MAKKRANSTFDALGDFSQRLSWFGIFLNPLADLAVDLAGLAVIVDPFVILTFVMKASDMTDLFSRNPSIVLVFVVIFKKLTWWIDTGREEVGEKNTRRR